MYKTLSFDDIKWLNTRFFWNLKKIYEKEGFIFFKQFIKKLNDGITDEILYFSSQQVFFRIVLWNNKLELIDETSNIRLKLDEEIITKVHNFLKKKLDNKWTKNIANTLIEKFETQNMERYLWKHFLVYDIETIWNIQNLRDTKFMIAYMIDSKDFKEWQSPKYKYISRASIDKFVDYLYNYDGYIIGYNSIAFDNPVTVYNSSFENEDEILKELNRKSLDLFYIYSKIFWKRIWLNAVASSIVWISKTLSSWAEGSNLLKKYETTQDKNALSKVKNYCKNDVKMTLTILLYLIFNWHISYQEKDIDIDIDYILKYWCLQKLENDNKNNILDVL